MRAIALDVGDKTIGVAVSDALLISANGITTIERIGIKKDCDKVLELAKQNSCEMIVMGLPLMLSGEDSPQTTKVREFVTLLENKLRSSGLSKVKVVFQDERFTTKMSEAVLMQAGVRRENRKQYVDKMAAQIILQSYMDANPRTM